MHKCKTLVSLGCSWTFGVGANYTSDMSHKEYSKTAFVEEMVTPYSFRTLLAKEFNLQNYNISLGGVSNARNFRKMREILSSDEETVQKFLDTKPIILWGITSTARLETFSNETQSHTTTFLNFNEKNESKELRQFVDLYTKLVYDHDYAVNELSEEIAIWNTVFKHYNIPVIWYDSFNTHNYPLDNKNLLGGDLLTNMLKHVGIKIPKTRFYHYSSWMDDDPRLKLGVNAGLLNPFSFHPTKEGHDIITEIIHPMLEFVLNTSNNE